MGQEILAIAYIRPEEGKQEETLAVLSDLYAVMARKGYSRNRLYRDADDARRLVNVRYWASDDARRDAQEDPDVQRHWALLGRVAQVEHVLQNLDEIPAKWTAEEEQGG